MRFKVVLCLAVAAGCAYLLLRKTLDLADNTPAPVRSTRPKLPVESASRAQAINPSRGIAERPGMSSRRRTWDPSFQSLWRQPVSEPGFAAFKDWVQRFQQAASPDAKAAL